MRRQVNDLSVCGGTGIGTCAWDEIHELRVSIATDLKARAGHYRRLSDMLFDPRIAAVVRECATELEREAGLIEDTESRSFRLRYSGLEKPRRVLSTLE